MKWPNQHYQAECVWSREQTHLYLFSDPFMMKSQQSSTEHGGLRIGGLEAWEGGEAARKTDSEKKERVKIVDRRRTSLKTCCHLSLSVQNNTAVAN
jgi:hypothetical protein